MKLAIVTPLPPQHTGIADYAADLIIGLKNHVSEMDLFSNAKIDSYENIKVFNIEKECSVCHDLPKFAEKEKDFLDKKLDYHRKQKRITMTQEEYDALKKRILAKAKPEAKK